jgi:tryptophan 2,3-dioxygenase
VAFPDNGDFVSYSSYLKVPELLQQQHCLAEPESHDELQFIIVHQVYELWFKLIRHELDTVHEHLRGGSDRDFWTAIRLLRRVQSIGEVLVKQIHVLETMRPHDFLDFRRVLNPASGFQSVQFREVECMLGLKDELLASFTKSDPRHPELQRRLAEPSLRDTFYAQMAARGLDVTRPEDADEEAHERTLLALKTIYDAPDDHALVYELCESLIEVDEQFILWRRHHIMMVERQIGDKPGTGKGTMGDQDGIRYLSTTLTRRAFPALWEVRTRLTD